MPVVPEKLRVTTMKLKKDMRTLSLILVMALLTTMFIPAVSAEIKIPNEPEEVTSVTKDTSLELPDFQPSIMDELSYEDEKNFIKYLTPTPPLKDSDTVQIIVPKKWLLQNDEDKSQEIIKFTIPSSWLKEAVVNESEPVVSLQIPKKMLELDNSNSDPNMITVSYPLEMFNIYQNMSDLRTNEINSKNVICPTNNQLPGNQSSIINLNGLDEKSREVNKATSAWYHRNTNYDVITVFGIIKPISYSNQGETFRNYKEREIRLNRDGDTIEFISDYIDSGNSYIWTAIYDEHSWITPWNWLLLDVTGTLQQIEYRLYINNGIYDLWLKDTSTGNWYHNSYDDSDNPSTKVEWLAGTTEVDTVGGISEYFRTETNPIRDEWTYANNDWHRPKTTFNWNSYNADEQYVYINAWWDGSDRLNTQHIAGTYY